MVCQHVTMPDGGRAIVCTTGRRPRCACGAPAPLECDWQVKSRRSGTCDAPICRRCATSPAPGKDVCAKHRPDLEAWQARRAARQGGAA